MESNELIRQCVVFLFLIIHLLHSFYNYITVSFKWVQLVLSLNVIILHINKSIVNHF